jgi:hypothetical protein
MERAVNKDLPVRSPRGVRRAMLMLLALVYLFVGVAHNIACLDQAVASSSVLEKAPGSGETNNKPEIAICDHCPTCVPAVMPSPAMAQAPSAHPSQMRSAVAEARMTAPLRLDTPPPKA